MRLLDAFWVRHLGEQRRIELLIGDLTAIPPQDAVDVLVVSAFRDNYAPVPDTVIGALHRVGVSVAVLARDKEVDLRQFSSCWLSKPVNRDDLHFVRILCFEPGYRGIAPEVAGDVFRSLVPFVTGKPPIRSVAMPILASGNQGEPATVMLDALVHAALHWMSSGLPLDRLKLVITKSSSAAKVEALREAFDRARRSYEAPVRPAAPEPTFQYDMFISYSHKDKELVDELVLTMHSIQPALKVFMDCLELNPGAAWQQHIFEALDSSHFVMCLYSPDYLASKVCQEEFNVGLMRHRETEGGVLIPVYLFSARLPTYMRMVQYEDIREGDRAKLGHLATRILSRVIPTRSEQPIP